MHILLHIAAFIVLIIWIYGCFFLHYALPVHLILLLAIGLFVAALYKRPGKRTIE